MAGIGSFDATQVAPSEGRDYEPIPAGEYTAMVVDSDVKETRAKTGHYAKLTWEVLDGPHKGRKIFDNINLDNPNPEAVRIGQEQLSAICHAVGVLQISDTVEIHDRPCRIKVKVRPAKDGYDAQNEITKYQSTSSVGQPAAAQAAPAAQQQPAAGQKKAPPWAGAA